MLYKKLLPKQPMQFWKLTMVKSILSDLGALAFNKISKVFVQKICILRFVEPKLLMLKNRNKINAVLFQMFHG